MKALAALALSASVLFAQSGAPAGSGQRLLHNAHVTAWLVDSPARAFPPGKPHGDLLTVFPDDGERKSKEPVSFTPAGADERDNRRAVVVQFADPQGRMQPEKPRSSRYCNPGSKTACVEEKYLFCTARVCVENVTMGAEAVSTRHSHDTDHMMVAITDYSLSDDVVGKGVRMRTVPSGGVEYIPAGITHTLTNKTGKEIRFVVVVFR